jgi:hypothetical protein
MKEKRRKVSKADVGRATGDVMTRGGMSRTHRDVGPTILTPRFIGPAHPPTCERPGPPLCACGFRVGLTRRKYLLTLTSPLTIALLKNRKNIIINISYLNKKFK